MPRGLRTRSQRGETGFDWAKVEADCPDTTSTNVVVLEIDDHLAPDNKKARTKRVGRELKLNAAQLAWR